MSLDTTPLTPVDAFTADLYPPKPGTDVLAADVAAAAQVLLNRTENLNNHKAPKISPTLTGNITLDGSGGGSLVITTGTLTTFQASSTINMLGELDIGGTLKLSAAGTLDLSNASGRQLGQPRVVIADGNITLDLLTGSQHVVCLTPPGADRIVTLKQTTTSNRPPDGYWFEVTWLMGTSVHVVSIIREGSGDVIANFGDGAGTAPWAGNNQQIASARFKKQGGVWKLDFAGAGPVFYAGDT